MNKEETVKQLAELKKLLNKLIEKTERELEFLKACMILIDEELAKKSFIRAEELLAEEIKEKQKPVEEGWTELATITYRIGKREIALAKILYRGTDLRIVPLLKFSISTPPFETFFIKRVLDKMKERDQEKVMRRIIPANKALTYEIALDGDIIKEIIVKNVIEEDRVTSIKNAAKWTFTRMYERYLR